MGMFRRKKKKRVCVIGLDGVPHWLLQDMAEKGIMPAVKDLIDSGHLHQMKASLPEISAVSWTNFMTGSNPGTHGIFGFTDLKPGTYDLKFPNFLDLKKETIWDNLGKMKKRSIVINQPSTYPARNIPGILISGFVAIELSKAVYPLSLAASLEKMDYQIDIDTSRAREDHDFLWDDLMRSLQKRTKAFTLLWNEDWDFFEFVITGTDRLQHFLWNAYQDEGHAFHQKFLDYYHEIDGVINRIVDAYRKTADSDEGLFLLSDHGFTGINQEVYLNAWLETNGYLGFESSTPQSMNEISASTKAFALDPNRIYLHLEGRFPSGCVKPEEKSALKQEISQKLRGLEYEGNKVVRQVFDAETIYQGPLVSDGPDLIVLSEFGFDMKGSVKKRDIFGRTNLQGMHTWDDAFFWACTDYGQDLTISDIAAIILDKIR
jgi:predicted AlkP superfamily phosphohydrolase/phosphomutase